jgi:predicted GIY-YIG superfamily endonuclease
MSHFFYLARCADGSLYAGTCVDPAEREKTHNAGKGSKYTRSRLPLRIIHLETFETLSEARKREAEVKRWNKAEKEVLLTKTARLAGRSKRR